MPTFPFPNAGTMVLIRLATVVLPASVTCVDEICVLSRLFDTVFCHPFSNKKNAVPAATVINTNRMVATMGDIALVSPFNFLRDILFGLRYFIYSSPMVITEYNFVRNLEVRRR